MRSSTPPKWSLHYQAWRIERLQTLTARMSRKDALAQLASEEIGAPWRESQPLPPLNWPTQRAVPHSDGVTA